jgi:hypothetical protein
MQLNNFELTTSVTTMNNFELQTKIAGKDAMQYMADLLEKNDKQQIEIERGKLNVAILKQMNNRSRLLLDAAKYELKRAESERQAEKADS